MSLLLYRFGFSLLAIGLVSVLTMPLARSQELRVSTPPALESSQAERLALENAHSLKIALLDVGISRDKISEARSHLYPKMHFTGAGVQLLTPLNYQFDRGVFGTFPETGPIPARNTNVENSMAPLLFVNASVIQPVFQVGRVNLAVRQAHLAHAIAQEKVKEEQEHVVSSVKHAYYKALELQAGLEASKATNNLFREIERTTNEYLKEQSVLKADLLDVQQQLARSNYENLKQQNALASQKEEINVLLGRNPQMDFSLVPIGDPGDLNNIDLATAQIRARTCRAEIRQTANETQQVDLERRSKKAQYLPDLSLVLDYFSLFGTQVLPRNVVFAGFLANWEPIDWGRRRATVEQQHKLVEQTKIKADDAETRIMREVNDAFRAMDEAKQYVPVAKLGQELALERLRVLTNKYKEQAVLLKEVLQAQKDLAQANGQYNQAILALWTAKADLEKAIGEER